MKLAHHMVDEWHAVLAEGSRDGGPHQIPVQTPVPAPAAGAPCRGPRAPTIRCRGTHRREVDQRLVIARSSPLSAIFPSWADGMLPRDELETLVVAGALGSVLDTVCACFYMFCSRSARSERAPIHTACCSVKHRATKYIPGTAWSHFTLLLTHRLHPLLRGTPTIVIICESLLEGISWSETQHALALGS